MEIARRKRLITEINMVPFIDIVLVLLIIFMILSPFLAQSQIPVNLPRAATSRPGDDENPFRLRVTRDGDYYLGDGRVLRDDLPSRLAQQVPAGRALLIEADRDVSFKNVVLALDAAQKLVGVKVGVAVLTARPEDSTPDAAPGASPVDPKASATP